VRRKTVKSLDDLSPEEFERMLEERIQEWSRQLRKEGRHQGEANLLLRQLEWKFGPLAPKSKTRVRKADTEHLLEWGRRILTAERLDQVFGD
jgi:hypothetical protein